MATDASFGEYGYHLDGVFIALACDNSLFLKQTQAVGALGLDFPLRPPYPGAKPYPLVDELLDEPEILHSPLLASIEYLPPPTPSKSRRKG